MGDIFQIETVIDEFGNEHEVFVTHAFEGKKYIITKDKNILIKEDNIYKIVPQELALRILEDIAKQQGSDIIEYGEREDI